MAITSKTINLAQLDAELGKHGLCMNDENPKAKIITVAENSPITDEELDQAIEMHNAVFEIPSIADKLASVGLSIDELKAALA